MYAAFAREGTNAEGTNAALPLKGKHGSALKATTLFLIIHGLNIIDILKVGTTLKVPKVQYL